MIVVLVETSRSFSPITEAKLPKLNGRSPLTLDQRQVKKPPPSLQITSDFLVFHGLSHGNTLEKKCLEQILTYSKIWWTISWNNYLTNFAKIVQLFLYRGHTWLVSKATSWQVAPKNFGGKQLKYLTIKTNRVTRTCKSHKLCKRWLFPKILAPMRINHIHNNIDNSFNPQH